MVRLADPDLADRRRRQIMDAAFACFRRRGFHQATMAEICAEAEMSAGALYRYFRSKAEIIGAISEEHRSEGDEAFTRLANEGGVIHALEWVAREFFVKFAQGDGSLIAEIIAEGIRDETMAQTLRNSDASSVALCVKALKVAQKNGDVDPKLDPEGAAATLFGAIEGIGLRRALMRDHDVEGATQQFRALAERYLSPRP
jgi:AcrR family transcriptional regulator